MVIEVCVPLAPRFIRLRDAPRFFGTNKNRFNREVRPHLTEIRIGTQGRAFDRLEMEAAAEEYKSRNGVKTKTVNSALGVVRRVLNLAACSHLAPEKLSSVASRIERQSEGASLMVAPRGKNVAENATFSLRLVN